MFQSELTYYKYQGLGNDYIVIDPATFQEKLTPAIIKSICHRNYGIGSDGILYGPLFSGQDISFKIFNPDGSEAEKSGNGIRIFAKYLKDNGYVLEEKTTLHTKGGIVHVRYLNKEGTLIEVNMGKPIFLSKDIPVIIDQDSALLVNLKLYSEEVAISCVSMGNPHCVIFMEELDAESAKKIGPLIETHDMFPNRTNVQFVNVIDKHNIKIEIWERGAGYTLASGSSSCAAAAVSIKLGYVNSPVTVHMPGGLINIIQNDQEEILMTGPVGGISFGMINPSIFQDS
jgi:diaminopimelate epimerase